MIHTKEIVSFTFQEIKAEHKIECPDVSLEFFMQQYCQRFISENPSLNKVEVIVSPRLKFEFRR